MLKCNGYAAQFTAYQTVVYIVNTPEISVLVKPCYLICIRKNTVVFNTLVHIVPCYQTQRTAVSVKLCNDEVYVVQM